MLLESTEPKRTVHVRLTFFTPFTSVGVWLNDPPPWSVPMLLMKRAGRLEEPNALTLQDSSRLTGREICVPRGTSTPPNAVSVSAVNVEVAIGSEVRTTLANTNRLRERAGSASENRSERLSLYVRPRSGFPAVGASGVE